MRLLNLLLLLPSLALSTPITPRQSSAQITSVSLSGNGCPSGTYTVGTAPNGLSTNVGFDAYATEIGPGANPSLRELTCDLNIIVNFPVGCTNAVIRSTYHGYAEIGTSVAGFFRTQYNISPGSLTGGDPPLATYTSAAWGSGGVYTKTDLTTARVSVNHASQRNVNYVVRTRVYLTAQSSAFSGVLTDDDVSVEIVSQSSC